MTATVIAAAVEKGKLAWTTTLAAAFPDATISPGLRVATLVQVLAHRGGFPGETAPPGKTLLEIHALTGTPREQRDAYVRLALAAPPAAPPGSKFVYSNMGYTVAAAMAERAMNASWEELIEGTLFRPLGMSGAGFGAMGNRGKIDAPLQHSVTLGVKSPVEPGPLSDNPIAIGPADRVHAPMDAWGHFILDHLRGARGKGAILQPATYEKLHTAPFGGEYFAGWAMTDRKWGGGPVLMHAGSNTLSYAVVWMAPLRRFAVLAATNQGGDTAAKACDDVAGALIREHGTR
jgi:CubicO group peptidase (beta-lactamase class C family)